MAGKSYSVIRVDMDLEKLRSTLEEISGAKYRGRIVSVTWSPDTSSPLPGEIDPPPGKPGYVIIAEFDDA